jgi:hypothetical protein
VASSLVEMIPKLKFELFLHPVYSPDHAPSDYHIFGLQEDGLHGCRFANDEEVKDMAHTWLCA